MANTKKIPKPQEEPTPIVPTAASAWKGKVRMDGQDLELPSGNVARVRNISPEAFFASGFMPDSLTNLVREAINKKSGLPPAKVAEISKDPKKILEAMDTFNRVLTYCVIEPPIEPVPGCAAFYGGVDEETPCERAPSDDIHTKSEVMGHHRFKMARRDPDVLYADEVNMDDKLFVFQWALGGTSNLEQFRQQQRAALEPVSNRKTVGNKAKRPAKRS